MASEKILNEKKLVVCEIVDNIKNRFIDEKIEFVKKIQNELDVDGEK